MRIEVPLPADTYQYDERRHVRPMPASLDGITIGILDNSKAGGDVIIKALAQRIADANSGVSVHRERKEHSSLPVTEDAKAALAATDLVITALGDCGSCSSWTIHDSIALESAGVPVVAVCTQPFEALARAQARALGIEDLRVLIIEHPIAELPDDEVRRRLDKVVQHFDGFLAASSTDAPTTDDGTGRHGETVDSTEVIDVPDDKVMAILEERRIFDGLPLVTPTPALVDAMLEGYQGRHDEVLGSIAPKYGAVTPRNVAVAAVLAGCEPAYFPVVLASVRAVLKPAFNLNGVQCTTHPVAVFTLVSGPITEQIGMNAGINAFGQGNRANATIGRALRLALVALGGAWPGDGDMATHGIPAKYSFTVAENVAASPWGSLAESLGHGPDENVVVTVGAEAPQNVNDHESESGLGILRMIAGTMRSTGMNNGYYREGQVVVVAGPEHAATIAAQGYSRRDIQDYLFAEARIPVGYFSQDNIEKRLKTRFPTEFSEYGPHATVPVVHDPENILLCVVGGPGKHCMFMPTFGATRATSATIV